MTEQHSPPTAATHPSRGRSIAAAVCVVLAALLTRAGRVAFWGQRTLTDGQRYMETVGPLVDSPEVQAAIATKVTDAIQQQVDVEAILNEAFAGVITDRPRLKSLVGPLSGAVNGLIESQVRRVRRLGHVRRLLGHGQHQGAGSLVRLLEGDRPGPISLQGEQVVLDVSDVIDQVKQRLVARGLTIVENGPDPRHGQADRAAGRAAAEAGADDLRVREPAGQVADHGRGGALPRRARCSPAAGPG